jgi:hypothetical protein
MHEIQMILGNVAALSEPTIPRFVPRRLAEAEIARSLAVIRQDLSAHHGEFCPMLLKAGQHRKIGLIQHGTAVPLDIAGARALLLLGSTVLSYGGTGRDKRQSAADEDRLFHRNLLKQRRALRPLLIRIAATSRVCAKWFAVGCGSWGGYRVVVFSSDH